MKPSARRSLVIGAAVLVALIAAWAFVQMRSQTIIQARHALPPSAVKADMTPDGIALGRHLVEVSACSFCHGRTLSGRMLAAAGSPLAAPNLTRAAARRSDAELDHAIRAGLRPDGTTEFAMPSQAFAAFTDRETSAIVGYLRTLKPQGAPTPKFDPSPMQRLDIAVGFMHPAIDRITAARRPLDLGPRTATGRHLTAVACGQCHGTDLSSGHGAPGPDLMVRGGYKRAQFHALMRKGETAEGRDLEPMSQVAQSNFSQFTDAEIDAIYDYLDARDGALAKAPPPKS